MDLFTACRQVTARQAAERIGLPLKLVGQRAWTRCPLHGEKTASLLIYEGGRGWYCYGCHAGGDAVRLYELFYGMDSLDAARRLAQDFGIPVEAGQAARPAGPPSGTAYDLMRAAERWYNDQWAALTDAYWAADAILSALPAEPTRLSARQWQTLRGCTAARTEARMRLDRLEALDKGEIIQAYLTYKEAEKP